ncbi:MAG: PIN domain-containing protein [Anaerolinea sp.]|nr:PIN domain-containing protein [Anaerolinea sp.]
MIRVLLDTNVVLDFLMDRAPFADAAAAVWEANRKGQIETHVSAITPVNVFYIARKLKGMEEARKAVEGLLAECRVAQIDLDVLQDALTLPFQDYEDAVQLASAVYSRLDFLVTRDPKDYTKASLPVLSPSALLTHLPTLQDEDDVV